MKGYFSQPGQTTSYQCLLIRLFNKSVLSFNKAMQCLNWSSSHDKLKTKCDFRGSTVGAILK